MGVPSQSRRVSFLCVYSRAPRKRSVEAVAAPCRSHATLGGFWRAGRALSRASDTCAGVQTDTITTAACSLVLARAHATAHRTKATSSPVLPRPVLLTPPLTHPSLSTSTPDQLWKFPVSHKVLLLLAGKGKQTFIQDKSLGTEESPEFTALIRWSGGGGVP